jgi:hypothetical protein
MGRGFFTAIVAESRRGKWRTPSDKQKANRPVYWCHPDRKDGFFLCTFSLNTRFFVILRRPFRQLFAGTAAASGMPRGFTASGARGGADVTLTELSESYEFSARLLRQRLSQLRLQLKQTEDPEEKWQLQQRMAQLAPMLTEMNELAELTARYYERGFWRSEKYTV